MKLPYTFALRNLKICTEFLLMQHPHATAILGVLTKVLVLVGHLDEKGCESSFRDCMISKHLEAALEAARKRHDVGNASSPSRLFLTVTSF